MAAVTWASGSRKSPDRVRQGAVRERRSAGSVMHAVRVVVAVGVALSPCGEGASQMADLAYAVLLIGVFLVLALTLRGLEKL